ncbi:MAG TPA: 2OG-Fe(II) oxygenase [Burkholderiaceae bacterium]
MTAAVASVAIPRLPADWQEWLAGSVVRGAGDDEMLAKMRAGGFDDYYARVAISVVRSLTERAQQQVSAIAVDYQSDPLRLPAQARPRAADREVTIGFALYNPNVALLADLASAQECEKLMQLAAGKLRRSEVVDRGSGGHLVSHVRTSEGTHFERGENAIVQRIEQRIAALTGLPVENGEPLQILHYGTGGQYLPHHDYFDPADPGTAEQVRHGGQRVATVVIYLNDVAEGGETAFPELELTVRPRQGSAVYFEYTNARGELDARCLHAGAPVARGEKWIATKWLRQSAYQQ